MTRTTAAKPAARTATARVANTTRPSASVAQDDGVFAEAMKRYTEAQDYLLKFFKAPSWKRTLCAFVTTIVVGAGVGCVAGTLLEWLLVGAVAMAAPMFLVVLTWLIGFALAMYYGSKFCVRIGGAVLTGEADERAIAAYDAVKNLVGKLNPFGRRTIVAPAKAR